jgi:hypothetical protein
MEWWRFFLTVPWSPLRCIVAASFISPGATNCPSYTLSTALGFNLPLASSVPALWTVCMHSPYRGISAIMRQSCQYGSITHHAMWSFIPPIVSSGSWTWWPLILRCMLSLPPVSSHPPSAYSCITLCSLICPACELRPITHVTGETYALFASHLCISRLHGGLYWWLICSLAN